MEKQFESLCPARRERTRKTKLETYEISMKFKDGNGDYQITFSSVLSRVIKNNRLEYMDVRRDPITDEIDLVFSNKSGIRISYSGKGANANICCKDALQEICNTYGLEEKSRRMKITRNLSKHDGYLVFRLMPQTGERNLFYNAEE